MDDYYAKRKPTLAQEKPPPAARKKPTATAIARFKCDACSKSFMNAQDLGGHKKHACKGSPGRGLRLSMLPSLFGTESEDETSDENKGEGANEEDGSCGETDDWFSLYWLKKRKVAWRKLRIEKRLVKSKLIDEPKKKNTRGSDHRNRRTLAQKVEIGNHVHILLSTSLGVMDAYASVSELRRVPVSSVQKWYKNLQTNRKKLEAAIEEKGKGKGRNVAVYPNARWKGEGSFPLMEEEVYSKFLDARGKSQQVGASNIRYWARKAMKSHYPHVTLLREGDGTLHQRDRGKDHFLMSDGWLRNFKKRKSIRRRKKTNIKLKSAAEQQPKCQQFVKALQKRKRRYPDTHQCGQQGRWKEEDQYNGDEMPFVLENGDFTLADCRKGEAGKDKKRVHIKSAGGKHRICTLVGFLRFRGKQVMR